MSIWEKQQIEMLSLIISSNKHFAIIAAPEACNEKQLEKFETLCFADNEIFTSRRWR